jgi:hypothetical protein
VTSETASSGDCPACTIFRSIRSSVLTPRALPVRYPPRALSEALRIAFQRIASAQHGPQTQRGIAEEPASLIGGKERKSLLS